MKYNMLVAWGYLLYILTAMNSCKSFGEGKGDTEFGPKCTFDVRINQLDTVEEVLVDNLIEKIIQPIAQRDTHMIPNLIYYINHCIDGNKNHGQISYYALSHSTTGVDLGISKLTQNIEDRYKDKGKPFNDFRVSKRPSLEEINSLLKASQHPYLLRSSKSSTSDQFAKHEEKQSFLYYVVEGDTFIIFNEVSDLMKKLGSDIYSFKKGTSKSNVLNTEGIEVFLMPELFQSSVGESHEITGDVSGKNSRVEDSVPLKSGAMADIISLEAIPGQYYLVTNYYATYGMNSLPNAIKGMRSIIQNGHIGARILRDGPSFRTVLISSDNIDFVSKEYHYRLKEVDFPALVIVHCEANGNLKEVRALSSML
jgi:hypothetical protein